MKILHLVTSLNFGGLEKRMEILSTFPSHRNDIYFCALGGGGKAYEVLKENKLNVYLLELDYKIFSPKTLYHLYKFISSLNPDVVHTHGAEANFYGVLSGKLARTKLIVAEEIGIPSLSWKAKIIFKFIYSLADRIIVMSPVVKTYLSDMGLARYEKIDEVYNPVLMSKIYKSTDDDSKNLITKFVFLGRLEEVKNPIGLLRAFYRLKQEGMSCSLTYIGDGMQKEELHQSIAEYNLENSVFLLGFLATPYKELVQYDVVVQSSHTEGFSLALVEAMSCSLPVIATPVGGVNQLITEGENGWICSSSDDNHLYEKMKEAIRNKDSLLRMGKMALLEVTGKFDAKEYSNKLDDYYEKSI